MDLWQPAMLSLALFSVSAPTFGAKLSQEYKKCMDSTYTNSGWAECFTQDIKRQERWLSDAWNNAFELMKKISTRSAQMLLNEQRSWIKFKDVSCDYFSSSDLDVKVKRFALAIAEHELLQRELLH